MAGVVLRYSEAPSRSPVIGGCDFPSWVLERGEGGKSPRGSSKAKGFLIVAEESVEAKIARIDERGQRFETEIRDDIKELKEDLKAIKDYATRWRGGFTTLVFLGSFIAAVVAGWDHVIKIFTH